MDSNFPQQIISDQTQSSGLYVQATLNNEQRPQYRKSLKITLNSEHYIVNTNTSTHYTTMKISNESPKLHGFLHFRTLIWIALHMKEICNNQKEIQVVKK